MIFHVRAVLVPIVCHRRLKCYNVLSNEHSPCFSINHCIRSRSQASLVHHSTEFEGIFFVLAKNTLNDLVGFRMVAQDSQKRLFSDLLQFRINWELKHCRYIPSGRRIFCNFDSPSLWLAGCDVSHKPLDFLLKS